MSDYAAPANSSQSAFAKIFYRPPFVGLLAFFIVLVVQALGHTVMILMENVFGEEYVYQSAFAMGMVGAIMLFIGMRSANEVTATWLGFWAGTFLWTGWVEFSFVWSGNVLGVPDLMDPNKPGEIATKAEYLVMMSSIGILFATLAYFTMNKETKCNFFLWFQRNAGLRTGKPNPSNERNFAAITALETIYVVWFFYLMLLFMYDENILGEHHPVTYAIFVGNVFWSVFLFLRLIKFWRVTTAIRYGIPTAIICWNTIEIAGRWHLLNEFWEKPSEYGLEMTVIAVVVVVSALFAVRTPTDQKATLSAQELAARRA